MLQNPQASFALATTLLLAAAAAAHEPAEPPDPAGGSRAIEFPDTATHQTLVVDLHTHSVFSDGHVWPNIRVAEAIADGLDAVAITEHLEWQPHLEDIPHPDRNRAYLEALASVPEGADLVVLAGSEITRRAPYGHMNAVFVQDANALLEVGAPPEPFDPVEHFLGASQWPAENAVNAANEQGAFVFWNHAWSDFPSRKTEITDFHREAAASGKLHGIEIANGGTYSAESFQIALEHNLTLVGVSDVHNLIDWDYEPHNGGHRPVNLVFAREKSATAIRDALMAGHTVVWFRNLLLGREADLMPLLDASLQVRSAAYDREGSDVLRLDLVNRSDATFRLENLNPHTLVSTHHIVDIPPHAEQTLLLRTGSRLADLTLEFRVLSALTEPDVHPVMRFELSGVPGAPTE